MTKTMNELYDEYLASDGKTLEKDGATYWRVVGKTTLHLGSEGSPKLIATVPTNINAGEGSHLIDETGRRFTPSSIETCTFSGAIPRWYTDCICLVFDGIGPADMGDYLAAEE